MKKGIAISILTVMVIWMVLICGCTSSQPPITPTVTAIPTTVITTLATPVQTTAPAPAVTSLPTTNTTATPTTIASDPILHRWVRKIWGKNIGYEFIFYPDGSVSYKNGTVTMVSSNIKITPENSLNEASGTWTKTGENKYLIKILPTAHSGAQLIREYTLVPAHEEKDYPGIVIKDHIESSYETDAINKGQKRAADEMYYPERAKID
jgi:hypothetical protein